MNKIGYFDCFSGASGDMILGAMISAGLPEEKLRQELKLLNLDGWELIVQPLKKQGFAAVKVDVRTEEQKGHRHLHHIRKIIDESALAEPVKRTATRIFERLAEAEAKVHGSTIEKVHFHEVGAVDAIVDIVGAAIGVRALGIERVVCSAIPTGSGTVKCEHGVMPVPAPGTAELLKGVPLAETEEVGELTTPTGAAVLTTLAESFGTMPAMTIRSIGYGAGARDGKTRPNVLRLLIGEAVSAGADETADEIIVLETNLDDVTGQQVGHAVEALLAAGALDVFTTAIQMKKNRPGVVLSVLASANRVAACEEIIFTQTPTFGIRRHSCSRTKLQRRIETVETAHGPVKVKLGLFDGKVVHVMPEDEDCVLVSRRAGVTRDDVYFEAQRAGRARFMQK